jgi:hypothetical protein
MRMRSVASLIVVLAVALALPLGAGCHKASSSGPAWPAPSKTAEDGGESIEPRSTAVAASVEKSEDVTAEKDDKPATEAAEKPATASEPDKAPTLSPATQPKDDEVIMSEEIIIEIDE